MLVDHVLHHAPHDQARADHRAAVAPGGRDAGRSDRRHGLAAPHHTRRADRLAPEGPVPRTSQGRGRAGGLPDPRDAGSDQRTRRRDDARSHRTRDPRGRDRASARSRSRRAQGALAQRDRSGGASAPARSTCCCGCSRTGCRPTRSAISTRPAFATSRSSPAQRGSQPDAASPCPCPAQALRPGTLLMREWEGVQHRVMALDEGFAWNGSTYRSLSAGRPRHHRHTLERAALLRHGPDQPDRSRAVLGHDARSPSQSACAAPSTRGSPPTTGWTRTSTPSMPSARRPRPISRARPMRAGVLIKTAYDDGGFSGGSIERPAVQRLLADIRASAGSTSSWSTRSTA